MNFSNWTRFLQEVEKAREHDPGKKPEKDKVLKNDESNTRTETNKR